LLKGRTSFDGADLTEQKKVGRLYMRRRPSKRFYPGTLCEREEQKVGRKSKVIPVPRAERAVRLTSACRARSTKGVQKYKQINSVGLDMPQGGKATAELGQLKVVEEKRSWGGGSVGSRKSSDYSKRGNAFNSPC